MADYFIDIFSLDYRLNGFSVNRVMAYVRNYLENELEKNMDEYGTRKIFNKLLQILNQKKEFTSFVKERAASEEESYAPFIKKTCFRIIT